MNGFGFLIVVIALAFLWFALVRPQRKRQQLQSRMWQTLEPGDEIVTAGGIYGEVAGFVDEDVLLRIAPDVEVRVARRAVAAVTTPVGAEESAEEDESYSGEPR